MRTARSNRSIPTGSKFSSLLFVLFSWIPDPDVSILDRSVAFVDWNLMVSKNLSGTTDSRYNLLNQLKFDTLYLGSKYTCLMKIKKLISFLPLLFVVSVAMAVAVLNTKPGTYLSGWDNEHPEFNLPQYAHRALFGAWLEHEGTGGPAAQVHAANLMRVPILYLLSFLPQNLQRYAFVWLMYVLGGVGMYLYLHGHWLPKNKWWSRWLAGLGGVFYLLNPMTLQQFYIIFEMFAVQFAFFPFLLLSIHALARGITPKRMLGFAVVQLFLAPSAYQPLVFYLGMAFSVMYAGVLAYNRKDWKKSMRLPAVVLAVTLLLQSYWIVPNIYFTLAHSDYISQSKANSIFRYESLWSIRSAGDWFSLLTGLHYLFEWKDFDFTSGSHEFIFQEWRDYFLQDLPSLLLFGFGASVLLGLVVTAFSGEFGRKRWSMVLGYLFMMSFVWIDLFPTKKMIEWLFRFPIFFEVFRNPFTKFNVLLSLFWSVFFVVSLVAMIQVVGLLSLKQQLRRVLAIVSIGGVLGGLFLLMRPVFEGQLINEKLKVVYPESYFQMFDYLKAQPQNMRVLELPNYTFEGFEYYDWSSEGLANGYQGLGMEFFGMPQAFVTADFARWTESTDSFYYELRQAIDNKDEGQFVKILDKYRINLVVWDDSKVDSYSKNEERKRSQAEIIKQIGLKKVWSEGELTIYGYDGLQEEYRGGVYVPEKLDVVSADNERVYEDVAYRDDRFYFESRGEGAVIYPWASLLKEVVEPSQIVSDGVRFDARVEPGTYHFSMPGSSEEVLMVLVEASKIGERVRLDFPKINIVVGEKRISLPIPKDMTIEAKENAKTSLLINDVRVVLRANQTHYAVVPIFNGEIKIEMLDESGKLSEIYIEKTNGETWKDGLAVTVGKDELVSLEIEASWMKANLVKPAVNCSNPRRGEAMAIDEKQKVIYVANDHGVACSGITFPGTVTDMSYLLHFVGENVEGRSIKLFVNDNSTESLTKQYILPNGEYEVFYSLPQSKTIHDGKWLFNWETRSFGALSTNVLSKFSVMPLPLMSLSKISMTPSSYVGGWKNGAVIEEVGSMDVAFQSFDLRCENDPCVVALDQAYDAGWLAVDLQSSELLSHRRLNGWSNGWIFDKDSRVVIFYLPELIAILLLGVGMVVVGKWLYRFIADNNRHDI